MARALLAFSLLVAFGASAQDRFEIQVYDSEVAPAGEPGLEMHLNYVANGTQTVSPGGELPSQHVLHLTLEPHLGLFGWGELGCYLQGALWPDGSFDYAGAKLRFDARIGLLYASINPILSTDLQGPDAGHPQLEPAAKLSLFALPELSFGAEYYAGLGPIDSLLPIARENHHLFAVLDFAGAWFDLNLGVGSGFGEGEGWVAKAILGLHPRGEPILPSGQRNGEPPRQ